MKGLTPGVLIMAAGKGTRMKSALPKVLQPLLDRPLLDYLLRSVLGCEFRDVAVLVGSGGEQVAEHLRDFPVNVLWQKEQLGTGHAVRVAQDWWGNFETLLVLNGDLPLLRAESLNDFITRFNEERPDCAILSFVARDPAAYGRVIHGENGVRVVEFKDASTEQRQVREVNGGCYAFNVASLKTVIEKITNDNAQREYYLPDALKLMAEAGMTVDAYPVPEEDLSGVNTQSELASATAVMRRRILERWMEGGVRVIDPGTAWVGPDVTLAPGVVLMPNVQIWGNSRVGEGSVIGSGSLLTNAVLGRNVTLVANVVIEN
ncbi:MAG: bifunctional N-acetylglucosamine-1-phosphate uridyltransferase/glucosamine-1-phosphate acetyltransferase, partial [Synergistaceae bacterium]|nr:bifunctional N-acetylglucosamine-1-phosphate uridyltransferase/glucosamine-1-phosphate acetyltransferase [Synergistaceae bacterium]